MSRSLIPHSFHDPDIWVDASEWGIGIVVGQFWAAWKLIPNWRIDGHDMGWAEAIAVEIITMWIIFDSGISNNSVIQAQSDNTGVTGAHNRGQSQNPHINDSICVISTLFISSNTTLDFEHVTSAENRANPISCSVMGPPNYRLNITFDCPVELQEFISYV